MKKLKVYSLLIMLMMVFTAVGKEETIQELTLMMAFFPAFIYMGCSLILAFGEVVDV